MVNVQGFQAGALAEALFDVVEHDGFVTAARDGGRPFAAPQGYCTVDPFAGRLAHRVCRETGQAVQDALNVSAARDQPVQADDVLGVSGGVHEPIVGTPPPHVTSRCRSRAPLFAGPPLPTASPQTLDGRVFLLYREN